jgi:hypothetical protein
LRFFGDEFENTAHAIGIETERLIGSRVGICCGEARRVQKRQAKFDRIDPGSVREFIAWVFQSFLA